METLHVKLCGLTEADKSAFISLLTMSAELLSSPWECVEGSKADLEVYCFDSDQGIEAWQRRSLGCFTALLSTQGNITEAVDIVLKKPLRASQLSATLNLIEEKINPQLSTAILLQQRNFGDRTASQALTGRPSPLALLTAKIEAIRYKPAADLPKLNFRLPGLSNQKLPAVLLNETATRHWLQAIPEHPYQRTLLLTERLMQLSQFNLPAAKGLPILNQYLPALEVLLFERGSLVINAEHNEVTAQKQAIEKLNQGFEALMHCYLRIAHQCYQRGERPADHPFYLYSLNQACYVLVMRILHAFHHYQQPPRGTLKLLHHLYRYHEQAATLQLQAEFKSLKPINTFRDLYVQILLVGIADPYSLPRFAVLRLFKILAAFTSDVEIRLLTERQIGITNDFLLSGHFCVDSLSDELPEAMAKTPQKIRAAANTRLLNTQPALQNLLQRSQQQPAVFNAIERQLVQQITPQLNASYERRFHRLPVARPRKIAVFLGLSAVHQALCFPQQQVVEYWDILNEAEHGVMLMRRQATLQQDHIAQLVLLAQGNTVRLATLEWFCVDQRRHAQMGLELIDALPEPTTCSPLGESQSFLGIVLNSREQTTLITEKGVYSPERKLLLKTASGVLMIEAGQLINSTLDHEFFSTRTLQVL